jgi:Uma2 family endonuclease
MVDTLPTPVADTLPEPEAAILFSESDGPEPRKRLLTREEFHKMAEAGIFGPDERLELIDGEIYEKMSPQSTHHAYLIRRLETELGKVFSDAFECRSQLPLRIDAIAEPEPDICILPGSYEDFRDEHPQASATVLVIEIADSSLRMDRGRKVSLYARGGAPEYWIVNLKDRTVEVYREPQVFEGSDPRHGYGDMRIYRGGDTLSPLAAPEASIAISALLPPHR